MITGNPHEIIQSFISGLNDFLASFIGSREKETFTVTLDAAASGVSTWTVDADCALVGCFNVQPAGNSVTIARSSVSGSLVNAAGSVTARKVIAFFTGTTFFSFVTCREKFRVGEKVYLVNSSAGISIVVLLFET